MSENTLRQHIQDDLKTAMRARDRLTVSTIRMLSAAIKQKEIDERITLTDDQILAVIEKSIKQRHEAAEQFEAAGRKDLADKENFEIGVLQKYMPEPLTAQEVEQIVIDAIAEIETNTMRDMGKVMSIIKPKVQGRADIGKISNIVKAKLNK